MKTYNHAFDIAFAVAGSTDSEGNDVTPIQMREAIKARVDQLCDADLIEAVGAPYDTYEED